MREQMPCEGKPSGWYRGRVSGPGRTVIIIPGSIFAGILVSIWWFVGFSAEKIDVSGNFLPESIGFLNRLDIVESVNKNENSSIRRLIWCGDGFYVFTRSGVVLAMGFGEYGTLPFVISRAEYRGDPRKFHFAPIICAGP